MFGTITTTLNLLETNQPNAVDSCALLHCFIIMLKQAVNVVRFLVRGVLAVKRSRRVYCSAPNKSGWLGEIPDVILEHFLLPYLSTRDVVMLERVLHISVVTKRLRNISVVLTQKNVRAALKWFRTRGISPAKITYAVESTYSWHMSAVTTIAGGTKCFALSTGQYSMSSVQSALGALTHLQELDLRFLMAENDLLISIRQLTQLWRLHVLPGFTCAARCLANTVRALPLLRDLGIYDCWPFLRYRKVCTIANECTLLQSLTLRSLIPVIYHPSGVKTSIFTVMAPFLGNLHTLDIGSCLGHETNLANDIVTHCPNLTTFRMSRASMGNAFETGLIAVFKDGRFSGLRELEFSHLQHVTNAVITAAVQGCPHLRRLVIFHCPDLTYTVITALITHAHALRELDCRECPGLTCHILETLSEYRPRVRILSDYVLHV